MGPWVDDPQNSRPQRFAMLLSLGVGFFTQKNGEANPLPNLPGVAAL